MNARLVAVRRLQGRVGLVTTLLFCAAILSLIDAFRGGFFGNNGLVELLPGQSRPLSGPMPVDVNKTEDMVIEGQPKDGSVRLVPNAHFSGFWFGGDMWRGTISASDKAPEAEHVILVKDDARGKQNPILVFRVRVWPDLRTKNAHSPSFITRKTGAKPFVCAGVLAALGLVAGAGTFLLGRQWTELLAQQSCGEIYRVQVTERGTELFCELPPGAEPEAGQEYPVLRPDGEIRQKASVLEIQPGTLILLSLDGAEAKTGDVVCLDKKSAT